MSGAARRVAVAIACHNRKATTLCCLASLQQQILPPGLALEITVMDDGSSDGTAAALRAADPDLRLLQGDGSLFWGGAMALALAAIDTAAGQPAPEFALWLNDDVVLEPDAIASLVAEHDAAPGSIIIGAVREPSREASDGNLSYGGQKLEKPWHPLRLYPAGLGQPADTFQGNCVLVPLAARLRLGGIDPVFIGVQGMADTDYGLRARKAGVALRVASRPVGTCPANKALPPWRRPGQTRWQRLAAVFGPRGYPPRAWFTMIRRHAPIWLLPVLLLLAPLRALLAALPQPDKAPQKPVIALLEGVAPIYRLPLYRGLASFDDLQFRVYQGRPHGFATAEPAPLPLPLPARRGWNLYWPCSQGRIAWGSGVWLAMLADAVVMGGHVHDLGLWALWLLRQVWGRPRLIAHGHFRLDETSLAGWLRRVQARGLDGLFCYSQAAAENCRRHGIADERIFLVENTLDTEAMAQRTMGRRGDLAALRARLGVSPGSVQWLFVARLHAAKRLDLVLAAIDHLRASGVDCELTVIGDGPQRHLLQARPDIRWLGAVYDDEILADWFAVATALVMPDGVGLSAVHAMAHAVPVIAAVELGASGPEHGYLVDDENAVLVAERDAETLAAAMQRLAGDAGLQARLARGALQTAGRLGANDMVASYVAGLRYVLRGAVR
ncbi:glycosyltransferase [Ferrovibrio sp.]|uniref:glycosyltransferase n=1 Tax=Ferrovibrio sp. TaxID=1917215 RepID=UPI0025BCA4BB|nr:glycosyltransferase [Ferrovibrio sp.]